MRITEEQLDKYCKKRGLSKDELLSRGKEIQLGKETDFPTKRSHKYNAKKTTLDKIKFDSKAEADRYAELKIMEKAGEIFGLRLQPEYLLQEAFEHRGEKHQAIKYKADFQYIQKGQNIVEDVKGHKTPEYKIKKKLFIKKYPNLVFKETP